MNESDRHRATKAETIAMIISAHGYITNAEDVPRVAHVIEQCLAPDISAPQEKTDDYSDDISMLHAILRDEFLEQSPVALKTISYNGYVRAYPEDTWNTEDPETHLIRKISWVEGQDAQGRTLYHYNHTEASKLLQSYVSSHSVPNVSATSPCGSMEKCAMAPGKCYSCSEHQKWYEEQIRADERTKFNSNVSAPQENVPIKEVSPGVWLTESRHAAECLWRDLSLNDDGTFRSTTFSLDAIEAHLIAFRNSNSDISETEKALCMDILGERGRSVDEVNRLAGLLITYREGIKAQADPDISALREAISVNDRLPPKNGSCLVYAPRSFPKNSRWIVAEFYDDNNTFYSETSDSPMPDVTHWLPLPPEPVLLSSESKNE